jgi:hypothetical protein
METNEIIKHVLSELLQKTIEKKIVWNAVNANAFRWVKQEEGTTITTTLQKQSTNVSNFTSSNYILTIQDSTGKANAQINSATEQNIKNVLANIFIEAQKESSRVEAERQAEVIKNLLKGL